MIWDAGAASRLKQLSDDLAGQGVVDAFGREVRSIWRYNLDRWDPRAGDSVRLLGQMCAENVARRMVRDAAMWTALGLQVSMPANSLLLKFQDCRLHVVKAPQRFARRPDWESFRWENESNVRHESAGENARSYRAPHRETGIEPLVADQDVLPAPAEPHALQELFLVWAGDITEDALTSGWAGFPTTLDNPWLAVQSLWEDEAPLRGSARRADVTAEDRTAAEPALDLRVKPRAAQSSR